MEPTEPRIYTDEEQRQIKRKVNRIVWGGLAGVLVVFGGCTAMIVAGADYGAQDRYERCAAALADQTPKSMWEHSDNVPGAVNDAVDTARLGVIGRCMERLEQGGH